MSPDADDEVLVCLLTFPDEAVATSVARTLVDEGLAACVNLTGAIRSIYRWKGAVCDEPEVLAMAKTTRGALGALCARVTTLHPYEVPEVIALPVAAGHPPYLEWVRASVTLSGHGAGALAHSGDAGDER